MKYELLAVESDAKTKKGNASGYLTGVLYGAPSTEADGVTDLCPMATDECRAACLYGSGMAGVFPAVKAARVAKTRWYLSDPAGFKALLARDIVKLQTEASTRGMVPCARINGTFDVPKLAREMARRFPDVQFYDYTKIPAPWKRTLANYHLTFSFSGENLAECKRALSHGINVAVVFTGALPESWHGFPVVNGDLSDLRFLDPKGCIVGLKAKGDARKLAAGGFVQIAA